jgi:hypothetical protein
MVKRKNESWADNRLRIDFDMSIEDWDLLFNSQNRSCAICCSTSPGRKDNYWCLDHNHVSGKPRGILCNGCNLGLGNFKDNRESLEAAVQYLQVST